MEKKLNSKPMQSILNNLKEYKEMQLVEFREEVIV
jgi:hypothetical protein